MTKAQPVFAAKRVHIPREIMRELQDFDPVIDRAWELRLNQILRPLGRAERKYVVSQFIEPKGVQFDADQKRYLFVGQESIHEVASRVGHVGLKDICTRLTEIVEHMRNEQRPDEFARIAERAVALVDRFDSQEHPEIQKQKNAVRSALLYELVKITRQAQLRTPTSRRGLTPDQVQDYMIDVFLRHQYLGYRFRTLPVQSLHEYPDPFISGPVAREARIRQCDVILTAKHLYLIAPGRVADENPYSICRFLREESIMDGKRVYFNGIIVSLGSQLRDPGYQKTVEQRLHRTITLQRQISDNIVDLVEGIEKYHNKTMVPLLQAGPDAQKLALGYALNYRLDDIEQRLETQVLRKIRYGIENLARTNDDYEFLYETLRQMLIDLAGETRDFFNEIGISTSSHPHSLEMRMMALLVLLDKRKPQIFTPLKIDSSTTAGDIEKLMCELIDTLKSSGVKVRELDAILREEQDRIKRMDTSFKRFIGKITPETKKRPDPKALRQQIAQERFSCFLSMVRSFREYPGIHVYLECQEVIPVVEGVRHYAIAQGWEGIGKLPLLFRLEEGGGEMDLDTLRITLTSRL